MAFCHQCGAGLDPDGTCATCLLAGGFGAELESITGVGGATIEVEPSQVLEYDSFGPYRIVRLLGEGGMGAVYLAEQTRPLQRQVALKVVKLGMDSGQILSRFSYERQALAQMDHPNIARVYDAGMSEKGRPYFVMEYVDGLPITHYCDERRLNTRERLELFIHVCQALQHAHQKGVIHRDIKPSNVMVTEIDSRPVPKIIDFGIAKATGQIAAGTLTQLGQFIGTPEYMSPEQADLVTGDADTSSDVYSLGVLLYELLVGAAPFDPVRLRAAGVTELLRILRDEDAVSMTARLTGMGGAAFEIAERRCTDPSTLRRTISGDLNWIVMKAIEKDRRRRYSTAFELAADIRRHLNHQPVTASPPSTLYRAGKFVRRHRLPVITASVVLAALVVGIVATTWQAAIARRERTLALQQRADAVAARALAEERSREAVNQRNRAEQEAARAVRQQKLAEARLDDVHTLADAMLFELNDDVKDLEGGTKAREALVRLGQEYLNKEAAASETDPRRRQELGQAFLRVGDLQGGPGSNLRDIRGARESYARSAAILSREVAAHPRDARLRHLLTLAYVRQAELEEIASSKAAGLFNAERSAQIFQANWPAEPQGVRDRAEILQAKGDLASAEALRERILAANPRDPDLRWELAQAQLSLGASLVQQDNHKAFEWLQKSTDISAALSRESPSNVQYRHDLALGLSQISKVLLPLDQAADSLARAQESVAILQQLTGSDPRNASFRLDLSDADITLSYANYRNNKMPEALDSIARAIAIQQEQALRVPDNPDFPRQAARYHRMAAGYMNISLDFSGAMEQYRSAEAIDRKLRDRYPGRQEFAEALRTDLEAIGGTALSLGERSVALAAYRDEITVATSAARPSTAPAADPGAEEALEGLASAHRGMAAAFKSLSRLDDAIAEQKKAVAIYDHKVAVKADFDNQGALAVAAKDLSMLHEKRGDITSAIASSEKALRMVDANVAAQPKNKLARSNRWNVLLRLSLEYPAVGEYDRAMAASREMVSIAQESPNLGPMWRDNFLAQTLCDFGAVLLRCGRRKESVATLREAVSLLDRYSVGKEVLAFQKEASNNYLVIAEQFTKARREDASQELLTRLMPSFENMVRANPGNNLCRDILLRAYREAASTLLALGDPARSLEFEKKGLNLEPAPRTPQDAADRALRLARTGSLERRLGAREAGENDWREALSLLDQATRDSQRQWSDGRQDLSALEVLRQATGWAAWTREELGDLPQAMRLRESNLREAVDTSPAARAEAVRVRWLMEGERGDYRALFNHLDPGRPQILADLAQSWKTRADLMSQFGDPISSRLEAAGKAVEFGRGLMADDSTAYRLELGLDLLTQGDAFRAAGRASHGAESIAAYRSSRDCYNESLHLLGSGASPAQIVTLKNNLAELDERLRDADERIAASVK